MRAAEPRPNQRPGRGWSFAQRVSDAAKLVTVAPAAEEDDQYLVEPPHQPKCLTNYQRIDLTCPTCVVEWEAHVVGAALRWSRRGFLARLLRRFR